MPPLKISIVQETVSYDNLTQACDRACAIITQCAKQGAQLIVFGECWLTGYPAWIDHARDYAKWNHPTTKQVYRKLYENSLKIADPGIKQICASAAEHAVVVCLGFNEKANPDTGTLYNSALIIDADGSIVQHHRKIMPTHTERIIHAPGDGSGLRAVPTRFGKIGVLICWEHWMPLARQAMHDSGEEIHIALWPHVHEMLQIASRHYAFEARCFVIAAGQLMGFGDLPQQFDYGAKRAKENVLCGGSALIGPDGHYILEPCYMGPPIVHTEIEDPGSRVEEKLSLDVSGHYQRKDIFSFSVKPKA